MSLEAIPSGVQVLLDANILIYARRQASEQCRGLVERCLRREVYGVITSITVAEYCHRRMMQEAQSRGLSGSNPATTLLLTFLLTVRISVSSRDHFVKGIDPWVRLMFISNLLWET